MNQNLAESNPRSVVPYDVKRASVPEGPPFGVNDHPVGGWRVLLGPIAAGSVTVPHVHL